MQTLSTLPVSIVILATRTHKHITHQTQQKISIPYFVVRISLRLTFFLMLTVKILSFLRLTAKCSAVIRLTVNPIETLYLEPYSFTEVPLNDSNSNSNNNDNNKINTNETEKLKLVYYKNTTVFYSNKNVSHSLSDNPSDIHVSYLCVKETFNNNNNNNNNSNNNI